MNPEKYRVGLCFNCQHLRVVRSGRGSTFYLCQYSTVDPRYPRYPRLPVVHCAAHKPKDEPEEPHESNG